ncbi:MAG TPA: hypothetical protein VLT61_16360 [Anaeromyxobacteraceae bacterium]|nr:hypothetical protein [Anaeromyxobacteraceae bacterium]
MTHSRPGIALLLAIVLPATGLAAGPKTGAGGALAPGRSAKFRVGQVWGVKARPGEFGTTATIVKVDRSPKHGVIVHVYMKGIHVKSPTAPNGYADRVQHAPFAEEALARSVTALEGRARKLPDWEPGYRAWRSAYEAGKAGVFTVTVAEALGVVEKALDR